MSELSLDELSREEQALVAKLNKNGVLARAIQQTLADYACGNYHQFGCLGDLLRAVETRAANVGPLRSNAPTEHEIAGLRREVVDHTSKVDIPLQVPLANTADESAAKPRTRMAEARG